MTSTRRSWLAALGAGALRAAEYPDIRTVPADLTTPETVRGSPEAGRRVRETLPGFAGTEIHHALYLPPGWRRGGRYPVIAEYAGNGNFRSRFGDVSEGTVEGSNLGYGLSGGTGFIWICLPYVNLAERRNQALWWGDAEATTDYCRRAVRYVCERYGGDPARVLLTGFSRGAIACNYIGLRDDATAALWRAFLPFSHYDGVLTAWPYRDGDRESALRRLRRLGKRPQFIIQENSVEPTRHYLESTGVAGDFTFRTLEFRNHNDAWTLRDIPERRQARAWLRTALAA